MHALKLNFFLKIRHDKAQQPKQTAKKPSSITIFPVNVDYFGMLHLIHGLVEVTSFAKKVETILYVDFW